MVFGNLRGDGRADLRAFDTSGKRTRGATPGWLIPDFGQVAADPAPSPHRLPIQFDYTITRLSAPIGHAWWCLYDVEQGDVTAPCITSLTRRWLREKM